MANARASASRRGFGPILLLLVAMLAPARAASGFSYDEHRRVSNWAFALAVSCVADPECAPGSARGASEPGGSIGGLDEEELGLLGSFLVCEPGFDSPTSAGRKVPCSLLDRREPDRPRPRFKARSFGDLVALIDRAGTAHHPFLAQIGEFPRAGAGTANAEQGADGAPGGTRNLGDPVREVHWPSVDVLSTSALLSKKVDAMHSNVNHFQGDAITAFRRKHADTTALAAAGSISLVEAVVRTAAALHYLQDLHAPGHVVTARSDMQGIAANALHDRVNAAGIPFCLEAPAGGEDSFADRFDQDLGALRRQLARELPNWTEPYGTVNCDRDKLEGDVACPPMPGGSSAAASGPGSGTADADREAAKVCLSGVRHLDNRLAWAAAVGGKTKKLVAQRAGAVADDACALAKLPDQLGELEALFEDRSEAACLVFFGDGDLGRGRGQLAYLTLLSARAVLDVLLSFRDGVAVNRIRTFEWLPLWRDRPGAPELGPMEAYLNYGAFRFAAGSGGSPDPPASDTSDTSDTSPVRHDDPSLRPGEMVIVSIRGQTLMGGGEKDLRPQYRVEFPVRYFRPRTAVVIRREDIETEVAPRQGLQHVGGPFVVGGISYLSGDGYEAYGALLRGGAYWRRLNGQVSVEAGARSFDLAGGSSTRPMTGVQVEWGFNIFTLSLGLSSDHRPTAARRLERDNAIDFGLSFYVPTRRFAKMLCKKLGCGRT